MTLLKFIILLRCYKSIRSGNLFLNRYKSTQFSKFHSLKFTMKFMLCVLFTVATCTYSAILPSRLYFPEENDINHKRFLPSNNTGKIEIIDLLNEEVTVSADKSHVTYYLYTKNNFDHPHIVNNGDFSVFPHFDPSRLFFFIIHGWIDSHGGDVNKLIKAAVLDKHDANVIVVDWSPIAGGSYMTAKDSVKPIGEFVASFIYNDLMLTYNLDGSRFILIGHSLGAHIAGNAGSALKSKPRQIIGLDPAAPLFTVDNTDNRLDANDGDYVQVIHTNGRLLGFATSIGHADYYPNEGMVQKGCGLDLIGACSHARAFEYLAEAISGGKFTATLCTTYADYKSNKCINNKKSLMGQIDVDKTVVGDYFLDTNDAAPFALG